MRIKDKTVPLFFPLVAVISGIIAGARFKSAGLNVFLYTGLILFIISICFAVITKKKIAAEVALILSLILLSCANCIFHTAPSHNDISQILPFEGTVHGKVLLPTRHLIVRVDKAGIPGYGGSFSGKILLRWNGKVPPPGADVEVCGRFYEPSEPLNPGGFNWKKHLSNQRIFTEGEAYSVKVINRGIISNSIGKIRGYVRKKIYQHLPEKEAGVLAGILLGNPALVSPETIEQFRKSGVMHVLAVSGLHVGLVLFTVYYVFLAFGSGKTRSFVIAIIFMYLYVVVTGARPSAVRAAIMLSMLVAGDILGGRGNVYNSLCLAALLILGLSPGLLFTAGFTLSFLAVSGIVYISPSLYRLLGRPLSVSAAAVLAILPVLAWDFNYLPLTSPLTNLAVVPLAGIVVSLGMLFLAVSGFSSFLGEIYAIAISYVIKLIEYITGLIYNAGLGGMSWGRPSFFIIAVFYLVLILTGLKSFRKKNLLLVTALLVLGAGSMKDKYSGKNFVAVLMSGGAHVLVIKEKPGDVLVFIGRKDIDEKAIGSFIYSSGMRKIKHIYILHPPYEDMRGVSKLADEFGVKKIFYPGVYGNEKRWHEFKNSLKNIRVHALKKGDVISYKKAQIKITDPGKKYLDIRDNFMQAELLGKDKILIYAGGGIPEKDFDVIIAAEPYKPDWENIKERCSGLIIYYGEDMPPDWVYWIKDRGKVFYL